MNNVSKGFNKITGSISSSATKLYNSIPSLSEFRSNLSSIFKPPGGEPLGPLSQVKSEERKGVITTLKNVFNSLKEFMTSNNSESKTSVSESQSGISITTVKTQESKKPNDIISEFASDPSKTDVNDLVSELGEKTAFKSIASFMSTPACSDEQTSKLQNGLNSLMKEPMSDTPFMLSRTERTQNKIFTAQIGSVIPKLEIDELNSIIESTSDEINMESLDQMGTSSLTGLNVEYEGKTWTIATDLTGEHREVFMQSSDGEEVTLTQENDGTWAIDGQEIDSSLVKVDSTPLKQVDVFFDTILSHLENSPEKGSLQSTVKNGLACLSEAISDDKKGPKGDSESLNTQDTSMLLLPSVFLRKVCNEIALTPTASKEVKSLNKRIMRTIGKAISTLNEGKELPKEFNLDRLNSFLEVLGAK